MKLSCLKSPRNSFVSHESEVQVKMGHQQILSLGLGQNAGTHNELLSTTKTTEAKNFNFNLPAWEKLVESPTLCKKDVCVSNLL